MNFSCMGGWCSQRDRCALHTLVTDDEPAERLCGEEEVPLTLQQVFKIIGKAVH